eukprot:3021221-Rhodomonas_salina.2
MTRAAAASSSSALAELCPSAVYQTQRYPSMLPCFARRHHVPETETRFRRSQGHHKHVPCVAQH